MGRDYVIITDSSNDLPAGYAEEQGVVIIPISFEIGDEVFDGREKTLTKKEFYDRMRAGQGIEDTDLCILIFLLHLFLAYKRVVDRTADTGGKTGK